MTATTVPHVPVLLHEVLAALEPHADAIYVDGTFGAGGYARAILEAAPCRVVGIDRDPAAVADAQTMCREFPGRLAVLHGRFGDMGEVLEAENVHEADGVALDLGVSSMQIDRPERGFSFREDGPLDMRMDAEGATAAEVVNRLPESDLADIIHGYGEEHAARRIARAIVAARRTAPVTRTAQLANIVRRVLPRSRDGIDPATRTFQALRIHVNDELGELERGLCAAEAVLKPGGRLAVVSFHSLEDRRVKTFLRARSGEEAHPTRHLPQASSPGRKPTFRIIRRGTVTPNDDEIRHNPRARSARLRWAERTAAPAWADADAGKGGSACSG